MRVIVNRIFCFLFGKLVLSLFGYNVNVSYVFLEQIYWRASTTINPYDSFLFIFFRQTVS